MKYIYLYIYSRVKATKAEIASNFVPYIEQVLQIGQFCIKKYFLEIYTCIAYLDKDFEP